MVEVPEKRRRLRCAVYTRKSTEEGLDQEFNSLLAQRGAADAYIKSQRHLGWTPLPTLYDDGGFSGGNIERPALQRLLEDIENHHVDCVMVYKVDRLSRSLLDFARLMDQFDQRSVSLVSVTQQFNTTTSLGRLTLNILLSFAHYAECGIMQSDRIEVGVWRAFRWRGTRSQRAVASFAPVSCFAKIIAGSLSKFFIRAIVALERPPQTVSVKW